MIRSHSSISSTLATTDPAAATVAARVVPKHARTVRAIATLLLVGALAACQTTSKREAEVAAQATHDGLVQVEAAGLDQLWLKPGTTLTGYEIIKLDLADIAFRADWQPERQSPLYRMAPPDRDRIKQQLAETFQETFQQELEAGGYQLTDEAGRDTLGLRTRIVDLYLFAPDVLDEPGRVTRYTREAPRMTLVAELYDSVTGEVLARAVARERGMEQAWFERSNSIRQNMEARRTFKRWAAALRGAIDKATAAPRD